MKSTKAKLSKKNFLRQKRTLSLSKRKMIRSIFPFFLFLVIVSGGSLKIKSMYYNRWSLHIWRFKLFNTLRGLLRRLSGNAIVIFDQTHFWTEMTVKIVEEERIGYMKHVLEECEVKWNVTYGKEKEGKNETSQF